MRDLPDDIEWSLQRIADALVEQNELLTKIGALVERAVTPALTLDEPAP